MQIEDPNTENAPDVHPDTAVKSPTVKRYYEGISHTDIAGIQIGPFTFYTGSDGWISLELTEIAEPEKYFGNHRPMFSIAPGEYLFGGPDGPQSTIILEDTGHGYMHENEVILATTPGKVRLK
jgi:hypothetical protein